MKKAISWILSLAMVLSMLPGIAFSVGAEAPYTWEKTALADIADTDVVAIVVTNSTASYLLNSSKGSSAAPPVAGYSVTPVDGTFTTDTLEYISWNILDNPEDDTKFSVQVNGGETYLYFTNANNGVRVGGTMDVFTVDGTGYIKQTTIGRYLGVYGAQDFRCYTNTTGNTKDQTTDFYKLVVDEAACQHENKELTGTKDATCTEDGVNSYYCPDCGETLTEDIPSTGHDADAVERVDATCTEGGYVNWVCNTCGESWTETIDALGHDLHELGTGSTCITPGYSQIGCTRCDYEVRIELPLAEHDYVDGVCSVCGAQCPVFDLVTGDSVTAGKYIIVSTKNDQAMTADPACGTSTWLYPSAETYTDTSVYPASTYVIWNISDDGVITNAKTGAAIYSSGTGKIELSTEKTLNWGFSKDTETDAWVISDGTLTLRFNNTGWRAYSSTTGTKTVRLYKMSDPDACRHTNKTSSTIPATCTTDGAEEWYCPDCGQSDSTVIPALGHDFTVAVGSTTTCAELGTTTYQCSRCDVTEERADTVLAPHDYSGESCSVCGVEFIDSVDSVVTNDIIVVMHIGSATVLSAEANGTKLNAVTAQTNLSKLVLPEGAALLKVEVLENGDLYLTCDGKYLSTEATGNALILTEEPTDYSVWYLEAAEDGFYITSRNAFYNEIKQSIEYYRDTFTTYTFRDTSDVTAFAMKLYLAGHEEPHVHAYEVTGKVDPTCAADGYEILTCSGCGDVIPGTVIPATGAHTYHAGYCTVCSAGIPVQFVLVNRTADTTLTELNLPEQPQKYGYRFVGWSLNGSLIEGSTSNEVLVAAMLAAVEENTELTSMVLTAVFETVAEVCTVIINNEYEAEPQVITANAGEYLTVKAQETITVDGETLYFVNWTNAEGVELSTKTEYYFRVKEDMTLTPNYQAEEVTAPDATITMSAKQYVNGSKNNISLTVTTGVLEGCTVVAMGLKYKNGDTWKTKTSVLTNANAVYTLNLNVGAKTDLELVFEGFITYLDAEGVEHTLVTPQLTTSFNGLSGNTPIVSANSLNH